MVAFFRSILWHRQVLSRRFHGCSIDLQHLFLYVVKLLFNVVESSIICVAAVLASSCAQNFLRGLATLQSIYLAEDVSAKNLHFSSLCCNTHVRA